MMKVALALALFFTEASAVARRVPQQNGRIIDNTVDEDYEWGLFKETYHKVYTTPEEEKMRRANFAVSIERAQERNQVNIKAGGEAIFGITKFSDLSQKEFDSQFKGRKGKGKLPQDFKEKTRVPLIGRESLTATIDWTELGYTTPVKNQGQCGSCWAFSATEQIESQYMIAGGAPWELSVQQINSCTAGTFGCGGGDTTGAYEQLISGATKYGESVPGVASAAMVPYVQSMYQECVGPLCTVDCNAAGVGNLSAMIDQEALTGPYVGISDYSFATPACDDECDDQDLETLNVNVASVAPASICVNAANWNDYVSGVMTTEACGGYAYDDLDHCVQLTGFDLTGARPYYIVRNSWATNWGMDGFIHLSADGNTCGLADEATFVDVVMQ
jgi:hypothetical protein